jgi:hypothetical protein
MGGLILSNISNPRQDVPLEPKGKEEVAINSQELSKWA